MPIVTGNVSTFGLESVSLAGAVIEFIPSNPAMTGDRYVLTARTVRVPITPGSGAFTATLATTETTRPATFYRIRIVSLDANANFTHIDFPDWELRVPTTGGPIADLLVLGANPGMVWVGNSPPNTQIVPGVWWLVTDPESENHGWLMEWE